MTTTGSAGSSPGGGGGGGGYTSGTVNAGGAGAVGQVRITWTQASPAVLPGNTNGADLEYVFPDAGVDTVSLQAEVWGAGAGGFASGSTAGGAGGGGGEYAAEPSLAITPGKSYRIQIGTGGASGVSGSASTMAGDSVTVTANGGKVATVATAGGVGGTGSSNTTHHNGGAGGRDGTTGGGGGGGSAGPAAVGNAGTAGATTSGGAGATAVTGGGPGGAGGNAAVSGSTPASGPGGGGGARGATGAANGAGRDGQATLTFALIQPGVPILRDQFGTDLRVAVQIAWGADITAGESTWTWTDITTDVKYNNKVKMVVGKADQSSTSQPAQCSFTVDNSTAAYSQTPLGPNYPNVQKNTPVRVTVIYQGTPYSRFKGYATGFTPVWDTTGRQSQVNIVASGALRRLGQGNVPIQSFWKTQLLGSAIVSGRILGYWPCEDGSDSNSVASAIGGVPGTIYGELDSFAPSFAADSEFTGSAPLLTYNTGGIAFEPAVNSSPTHNAYSLFLLKVPDSGLTADTPVMSYATDTLLTLDLYYGVGGFYALIAGPTGVALGTSSTLTVDPTIPLVVFVTATASGSTTTLTVDFYDATQTNHADGYLGTVNTSTASLGFSYVSNIYAGIYGSLQGTTLGHLWLVDTPLAQTLYYNGGEGEDAETRLARLGNEEGINVVQDLGIDHPLYTMGAQDVVSLVNALRESETLDGGILYDGIDFGLHYVDAAYMENQVAALVLDASTGQLANQVEPEDDDLLIRNKWTVGRTGGSSFTAEQVDGPLGTETINPYADSVNVNASDDDALQYVAGWRLNLGTVQGYRWPTVEVWIHHDPTLIMQWLACKIGNRITVENLHAVRSQLQPGNVDLLLQGYTETLDQFEWSVVGNTASFDPWRVVVLAADTGDTNEFLCRLDTDGAQVTSTVSAGATSVSVTTPSGPLWTTAADDFPLYVEIGGLPVKVTNVVGSSSPQTFTLDGTTVLKALNAGDDVSVWDETVLGQGY